MIRIRALKAFFTASIFSIIIMGESCNNIPNDSSQADPIFIQYQSIPSFKVDSIMIFNEMVNHVVDFYGTRHCTLVVNNLIDTSFTCQDSIYSRITNLYDTIITVNGSEKGKAKFKSEDIIPKAGWKTLHKFMKSIPYQNLMAKIILDQLTEKERDSILACDTLPGLSDADTAAIIRALNEIIDSLNFYQKHKADIENEIFIIFLIDSLHKEAERLVAKSIFLDTTGTVNPNLQDFQKEAIRWFNWRIFVRYMDYEGIAVDYGKIFMRYPSVGRVYAMLFQQGRSQNNLREKEVLRFISLKRTGVSQIAYKDQYGLNTPEKTNISSYPFMCDTTWTTTQLFWWPDVPFIDGKDMSSLLFPGKAVLNFTDFSVDSITGDSTWFYDLKLYYPLAGELLKDGKLTRIVGSITVVASFYKFFGFSVPSKYQGYFKEWNTEIDIQATDITGNIYRYREQRNLISDDGRYNRRL